MQFFLLQTCTVYYEKPIRATFKIIPVLVEIINEMFCVKFEEYNNRPSIVDSTIMSLLFCDRWLKTGYGTLSS